MHGESYDAYPEVLAAWGRWRLIVSAEAAPATQWILQRSNGRGHWQGRLYFQDRSALRFYAAREEADPEALAVIDAQPAFCPQKKRVPGPSEPQTDTAGPEIPA